VLLIMLENKGYAATLGTCSADPYFCSLAAKYASFTNSRGISHPSEPNYVAFESGGIQGCTTDSSCAAGSVNVTDLGGQLTAAAVPSVGWMESMPTPCFTGGSSGEYVLKHSFGGFFKDEYSGACHIQPYPGVSSAVSTLNGPRAPDFVWITPNLLDDMHDGSVQQGDAWLRANLGPILALPWFLDYSSTVLVTMDEGDAGGANQIPTVVISRAASGKGDVSTFINHYAVLRAIETVYGLGSIGGAANAADISAFFG
jgi:phosphatidylinositol-3-phosphatase